MSFLFFWYFFLKHLSNFSYNPSFAIQKSRCYDTKNLRAIDNRTLYTVQVLRLPSLKICTCLLSALFFYDIFFVFITPLFMKDGKSVMVEVDNKYHTGVVDWSFFIKSATPWKLEINVMDLLQNLHTASIL